MRSVQALGLWGALEQVAPVYAMSDEAATGPLKALSGNTIALTIAETAVHIGKRMATAKTINGTLPGPLIRLREGQDVTLRVTNRLTESSSIHWHGLLVPPHMDGVPGVSFGGIQPGETFVYQFKIKQSGTYWYHSHSPGQEQAGVYAPLVIDPQEADPVAYDREYVVLLSDFAFLPEEQMINKLKKRAGYFNFQQRTMREFSSNVADYGWDPTMSNYLMWSQMRMDATDLQDATGYVYTYLMNGLPPSSNWTGLFVPGERVRLRFINVGAMTFHDVRIPGLKMSIVQADGQNVHPVEVDEFRFGPAETYDVIVKPAEDRAYTIFSEVLDRSGYARGTLAPRLGMTAAVPERRPRPLRTMQSMGMSMEGMDMASMKLEVAENLKAGGDPLRDMAEGHDMPMTGMGESGKRQRAPDAQGSMPVNTPDAQGAHQGHQMPAPAVEAGHGAHGAQAMSSASMPGSMPVKHGPDSHGPGNQTVPTYTSARLDDPGIGLGGSGRRVLVYKDLKALEPFYDTREPERELEIHLTGHMERFIWSLDGKKYSQAKEQPVHFRFGERLRWTFVNDTMMEHTMHLHGMWMHLENGSGDLLPRKHTVLVKPAERVSVAITADERGPWAFHCHLIMHMETGMFRVVLVSDQVPNESRL